MKKIYYLMVFVMFALASCDPLSQTYKTLDAIPKKAGATISYTVTTAYKSISDANLSIPATLVSKYPGAVDGTNVLVTFPLSPSYSNVVLPDTAFSHIAVTLTPADYTFAASTTPSGVSVAANSAPYFTSSTVLNYLYSKYPTPTVNQLIVLTYQYSETGGTPTTGNTVTDSFLYINGGWIKTYTISPAQYTAVNRGVNGSFFATSADFSVLASYFNTFLLADPLAMVGVTAGSVQYVSYKSNTTVVSQRIMALTYDGSNWQQKLTLPFLKIGGVWIPDPTVYFTIPYTAVAAQYYTEPDYQYLNTILTIGNTINRDNVAKYGDFNIVASSQYYWAPDDLTAAISAILLHKFPNAIVGVPYKVTYYVYNGATIAASKVMVFDGTAFNLQ